MTKYMIPSSESNNINDRLAQEVPKTVLIGDRRKTGSKTGY